MCCRKETLETALTNRVEYILREHYKTSPFNIRVRKKSSGLDSDVYLCQADIGDDEPIRLYTKKSRKERPSMKHEYETLNHLWDQYYYKERQMTVPKPIDYWEDGEMLSVERAKGSRLSTILGYEGLPLLRWFYYTDLREQMNRVANWLAHFHSFTRKTQRISFNEALQEDLENVILQWPPALSLMQIEKCATKLRDSALSLDTAPHIITGRHGDFDPDNIIISADQTCVIDFAYFSFGTPLLDVANFMVTLELHSTPFHTMSFHNLRFYRKLANDFLVTYNSTADLPFSKDEVNLYRVLKFIRALGYAKKALEMDPGKSLQTSPRALLQRLQSMYATQQIKSFLEDDDSGKKSFDK